MSETKKTREVYWTARICAHGHVLETQVENYPGTEQNFCPRCSAQTITACTGCNSFIRGKSRYQGIGFSKPAFCPECALPFPWTAAAIEAANKLARREFDEADRNEFADVVENLVKDSPSTHIAIVQFKALMEKAKPTAVEAFQKLLETVVTEGAKKILFSGS